jgi:hypothetical protein
MITILTQVRCITYRLDKRLVIVCHTGIKNKFRSLVEVDKLEGGYQYSVRFGASLLFFFK